MAWTFTPRWKEELVCSCAEGTLVLELMMGVPTIYLPPLEVWQRAAPAWARDRREDLERELRAWAEAQGIPVVLDEAAAVTSPQ